MKPVYTIALVSMSLFAACTAREEDGRTVDASGKEAMAIRDVPEAVLAAVHAARPDLSIEEAEYETRNGNEYYDVGGTLPDGSELEIDMTLIDGVWTAVEFQRDIGIDLLPGDVGNLLSEKFPGWQPERIIESDQGDGTIIYEFFGKNDAGEDTKIEIKWSQKRAELLADEWIH